MSSPSPRDSTPARPSHRERPPLFAWAGRIDDAIYAGERIVVTAALLVMSGVVCLNILYQFLLNQRATLRLIGEGRESAVALWPAIAVALAVIGLIRAAYAHSPSCRDNPPIVWLLSSLTFGAVVILCAAMLWLPSNVVTAALVVPAGLVVVITELDRPRPDYGPLLPASAKVTLVAIVIAFGALVGTALIAVPQGYTWAQKLALFLLLWMAFIGASMATHDRRHLTIDAVRKVVPSKVLPYFNFVSHLVAAIFTGAFMYLAFLYFADRLVEDSAPGEIPDWLKVLSIPVSLAFVTTRFVGQAVASLYAGLVGIEVGDTFDDHGALAAAADLEVQP